MELDLDASVVAASVVVASVVVATVVVECVVDVEQPLFAEPGVSVE